MRRFVSKYSLFESLCQIEFFIPCYITVTIGNFSLHCFFFTHGGNFSLHCFSSLTGVTLTSLGLFTYWATAIFHLLFSLFHFLHCTALLSLLNSFISFTVSLNSLLCLLHCFTNSTVLVHFVHCFTNSTALVHFLHCLTSRHITFNHFKTKLL